MHPPCRVGSMLSHLRVGSARDRSGHLHPPGRVCDGQSTDAMYWRSGFSDTDRVSSNRSSS